MRRNDKKVPKGDGKFDIFTVSCYFIAVVEQGLFRCS